MSRPSTTAKLRVSPVSSAESPVAEDGAAATASGDGSGGVSGAGGVEGGGVDAAPAAVSGGE